MHNICTDSEKTYRSFWNKCLNWPCISDRKNAQQIIHFSLTTIIVFPEYHVDNGWLYEEPSSNSYGIETLRILASHGSVIIVKRDDTVEGHVRNKYTITPTIAMDASAVNVEGWTEWMLKVSDISSPQSASFRQKNKDLPLTSPNRSCLSIFF